MIRSVVALAVVLIIALGVIEGGSASTPANITLYAPVSNDEPVVTWDAVPGADGYRLTGTIYALRVNANDPLCAPALQEDSQTLTLDEAVEASETDFQLPLPSLPAEDAWFFYETQVTLEAYDSEGVLLAAGNIFGIGETNALHCETPEPDLPPTGGGQGRNPQTPALFAFAAAVLAVIGSFAAWRAVARG